MSIDEKTITPQEYATINKVAEKVYFHADPGKSAVIYTSLCEVIFRRHSATDERKPKLADFIGAAPDPQWLCGECGAAMPVSRSADHFHDHAVRDLARGRKP